jgi:hypothetical protein
MIRSSVADLNPNNMRKAHSFGNLLEFDPGKYAAVRPDQGQAGDRTEQEDSEASSELANQGVVESVSRYSKTTRKDTEQGTVLATEEDEVDAPWNQYGWIEELQLRVSISVSLKLQPFQQLLLSLCYDAGARQGCLWCDSESGLSPPATVVRPNLQNYSTFESILVGMVPTAYSASRSCWYGRQQKDMGLTTATCSHC